MAYLCATMFTLSESNKMYICQEPTDMRMGVNCLSGKVRMAGMDPTDKSVYIFAGKSRQMLKILHWERGGYVLYYKRLEQGRLYSRLFKPDIRGFKPIRWDELVLLIEGISPNVHRRKRYQKRE